MNTRTQPKYYHRLQNALNLLSRGNKFRINAQILYRIHFIFYINLRINDSE